MQRVERLRNPILIAVALLAFASASMTTARFVAEHPGADLNPIADAGELISLIQGQEHLYWSSLSGPVTQIAVWGWPVSDGEVELGGGLSITRLDGGTESGIIDTQKPKALSFEVGPSAESLS